MSSLAAKTCVPCRGGVPPLKGKELEQILKQVPQWAHWKVVNEHHITRAFTFPDFKQALAFVNKVGEGADEEHQHFTSTEKLGTVSFPTSCSASVQKPFERGVALLHSFWYDEADKQFKQVEESDPKCAMVYWGQAMSLYHQLWSRPDAGDLKRGWNLLQKARAIGTRTQRERDYIEALSAFYRKYGKVDHEKRATAYAQAMEKVSQKYPEDGEAAGFYALSLLASARSEER